MTRSTFASLGRAAPESRTSPSSRRIEADSSTSPMVHSPSTGASAVPRYPAEGDVASDAKPLASTGPVAKGRAVPTPGSHAAPRAAFSEARAADNDVPAAEAPVGKNGDA